MTEHTQGYAVFLFDSAFEALGDAIKPYRQDGPGGAFIQCVAVDTGGAFVELSLDAKTPSGENSEVELMIPSGMVRLIASIHSESVFGFTAGGREANAREASGRSLPPVGPGATAAGSPSASFPHGSASLAAKASADVAATSVHSVDANASSMDDRRQPPEG